MCLCVHGIYNMYVRSPAQSSDVCKICWNIQGVRQRKARRRGTSQTSCQMLQGEDTNHKEVGGRGQGHSEWNDRRRDWSSKGSSTRMDAFFFFLTESCRALTMVKNHVMNLLRRKTPRAWAALCVWTCVVCNTFFNATPCPGAPKRTPDNYKKGRQVNWEAFDSQSCMKHIGVYSHSLGIMYKHVHTTCMLCISSSDFTYVVFAYHLYVM